MNKRSKFISFLLAMTVFFSALPQTSIYAETETENLEAAILTEQLNHFSNQLRPLLTQEEDNFLYSPLSYYLALLSLESGLTGEQQALLDQALLPEGSDRTDYLAALTNFLEANTTGDDAVFKTQTFLLGALDKEWSDNLQEAASKIATVLKLVDFKDPATYELLNSDIADYTHGLIDPFYSEAAIAELSQLETLELLALNMLYFKGEWKLSFNETLTSEATFHGLSGDTLVDMMNQTKNFDYLETDLYQAIRMNYTNGAAFVVVLPKESTDTETMWQYYDDALAEDANWVDHRIQLALPKWAESTSLDLTDSLDLLGLESFKEDLGTTDFFTTPSETFLSKLSQRIEFKLDEIGTEAASVTEILIETTSINLDQEDPIAMTIDRPFVYSVSFSDLPLFEGIVQDINN